MLLGRKCQYFLYLNLIKIGLEIMLPVFAQKKKKPFLTLTNSNFKSPKDRFFSNGLTHAFGQKRPIIWFI